MCGWMSGVEVGVEVHEQKKEKNMVFGDIFSE